MVFSFFGKDDKVATGAQEKRERAQKMRSGEKRVEGAYLNRRQRTGQTLATLLAVLLGIALSYLMPESVMSKLNITGVSMIDTLLTKRHGVDISGITMLDNFLSHAVRGFFFMICAGLIPFVTHLISFLIDKKNINFYLLNWIAILLIMNGIFLYGDYMDLYNFMSN